MSGDEHTTPLVQNSLCRRICITVRRDTFIQKEYFLPTGTDRFSCLPVVFTNPNYEHDATANTSTGRGGVPHGVAWRAGRHPDVRPHAQPVAAAVV